MCLAVPAVVRRIDGTSAEVDMGGIETRVSVLFTPAAGVGDYVIVHAGFAISILDREEAEETLRLIGELAVDSEE